MDSTGSEQGQLAESCEQSIEPLGSIKEGGGISWLAEHIVYF
jgi:hypothetical protein